MQYNSQRDKLLMPEYGRHVQNMLLHARTIEKKEDRQAFVEVVVNLMEQMQTSARPSRELTEKLWNHVFMIAGYDLDVDAPEDVVVVKHTDDPHPPKLEYPKNKFKFRHYGYHVQQLVEKAKATDDPIKKAEFANAIGSYMKLAYKTWNGDHFVNDEIIKEDLRSISSGGVDINEETPLDFLTYTHTKSNNRKKSRSGSGGGKQRKSQNRRRRR